MLIEPFVNSLTMRTGLQTGPEGLGRKAGVTAKVVHQGFRGDDFLVHTLRSKWGVRMEDVQ
jgi:hypothetical protein